MMSETIHAKTKPDSAEISRLLFDSMRALPEAQAYFTEHADDPELLRLLLEIALSDAGDTVRLQACYYIARYPDHLLQAYEDELLRLQAEEWESLSEHAIKALAKIRSKAGLAFLLEKRLAPKQPWETEMLRYHLKEYLAD